MTHIATSDCERCREGLVAQPVNTASSLAYVAAGAAIAGRGGRWNRVIGAVAVATGLGSVAYHGPGGRWGKRAHDWSIATLAAALVADALSPGGRLRPATRRAPVVGEWRRRARATRPWLAVLLLASAIGAHAASRTGGPLCRPDSRLQGHAAWHVFSAAALVLWHARHPATARV